MSRGRGSSTPEGQIQKVFHQNFALYFLSKDNPFLISAEIRLPGYEIKYNVDVLLASGALINAIRPESIPREFWVEMKNRILIKDLGADCVLTHKVKNLSLWIRDVHGQRHCITIRKMLIFPGMKGDVVIGFGALQQYMPISLAESSLSLTFGGRPVKIPPAYPSE